MTSQSEISPPCELRQHFQQMREPQRYHKNLVLLAIVDFLDRSRFQPRIHQSNIHDAFRTFARVLDKSIQARDFWSALYLLLQDDGLGKGFAAYGAPVQLHEVNREVPFLENIALHHTQLWSQKTELRAFRQWLWRNLEEHHPLTISYTALQEYFEPNIIVHENIKRSLFAAFHAISHKRFVILSGLSGTGKTWMLEAFAQAYVAARGLSPEENICKVAVSPDWRDPTPLLGYVNPLKQQYQYGVLTDILLKAQRFPVLPFFIIVDEMNLAKIERYFAPFLSAMETPMLPIQLHSSPEVEKNSVVPMQLERWPRNLFIGCTINMDESTHAISDKVLDRAFTIEFWRVDLVAYFHKNQGLTPEAQDVLINLYHALEPVRCHFGYRTLNEIRHFVLQATSFSNPADMLWELLDQGIYGKILPKIRGQASPEMSQALLAAEHACQKRCPRSAAKLHMMWARLQQVGVTRFWT